MAERLTESIREFEQAVLTLDRLRAQSILSNAPGLTSPIEATDKIIGPALERIGVGWQEGSVTLSQLYMTGRICEELLEELLPPESATLRQQPRIAIAVLQDHHSLGKRVVYAALRAAGYAVKDFDRLDIYELTDRVVSERIEILLISTVMKNSALRVKDVRKRLDAAHATVKIIVGGAPFRFDTYLWEDVGADAMGFDATDAVKVVARMVEES